MVESLGPANATTVPLKNTDPKWTSIQELAKEYDSFILDCDGVIWSGSKAVDQSFEVIQ